MRLVSVNVGLPREVKWEAGSVITGIFKNPVQGPVMARTLDLDGDGQADLSVHGGAHRELSVTEMPYGMFGENFTTEAVLEDEVHIGDRFRVGTAELVVTQPRLPCYKLGLKFGRDDMVKRFLASGRTGFYLSVSREGEVEAGRRLESTHRDPAGVTIPEITRLYVSKHYSPADVEKLHRVLEVPALPESWRKYFLERLQRPG